MSVFNSYNLSQLLEKLNNADSDIRYMAMNDLSTELQKGSNIVEESSERRIVVAILKALDDKNGEVKNLAVKTLGPLVKSVRDTQKNEIVDNLCNLLTQKNDELKDIASIGLKTVITEIPSTSPNAKSIVRRLLPKLVSLLSNPTDVQLDNIDNLSEVLVRFGSILTEAPAAGSPPDQLPRQIQDALFQYLSHSRAAVRKRTTVAIGNMVAHSSDELFEQLLKKLMDEVKAKQAAKDYEKLKTLISCIGTLRRLGKHLNVLLPLILDFSSIDEDELRENCLQTLDSFVLRCPTEISEHIQSLVALALQYIKYDPNYDDGEDDSMDVDGEDEEEDGDEMDEDEDFEEDEEEEDYSDDEDMSWKVRRASSKLLVSIINTRSELITFFFKKTAPVLINRFKEREESVRIDILSTFIALIRQTGIAVGVVTTTHHSAETRTSSTTSLGESDPRSLLQQQVPKICKALVKQLAGKSVQTRQSGFTLLRELVFVLNGGLGDMINILINPIVASLATSTAGSSRKGAKPINNPNLKIDVLEFLKVLLSVHPTNVFQSYLENLVDPIVVAAGDKFYKITSEALLVIVELIKVIRPIPTPSGSSDSMAISVPPASPSTSKYIDAIYKCTLERVKTTDIDLEVRERAILALGTLLSQTGDLLPASDITSLIFPVLLDRLRNELTRLSTVRVIKDVTDSPLCSTTGPVNLSPIATELITEISSYLRKSNRQLRVSSLSTLEALFTNFGSAVADSVIQSVLAELRPLLLESDLNIFPLVVSVISVILKTGSPKQIQASLTAVQSTLLEPVVSLVRESPYLVGGGLGLEALLNLWKNVVIAGRSPVYNEALKLLLNPILGDSQITVSKQAYRPIAQSIAALAVNSPADCPTAVKTFVSNIEGAKISDNVKYLSLLTIGEIGRFVDLSSSHPKLHTSLLGLFGSSSEEIKNAAAFAFGNVALGNLAAYMPTVISSVREGGKRRYLVLVSLKEIIARAAPSSGALSPLAPFASDLWTLLFANTEEALEEGTRTIISECLGKLALSDPHKYLPELQARLTSPLPAIRATVVTAIRYTFTDTIAGEEYDALLSRIVLDFLKLVKDTDLNVRQVSLATLNSAAHNKPQLILDALGELLPLLYQETVVKEELIHIVEMGPFKHRVDDGLEARKAAFECMYTLLENCLSRIEIFGFLDRVATGLGDPSQEIKVLNHLMIQRLITLAPTALFARLDLMISPLAETLKAKPKANAVKQEIEKLNELNRSAARTIVLLAKMVSTLQGTAGSAESGGAAPAFDALWKECLTQNGPVYEIICSVGSEVEGQRGSLGIGLPQGRF
ncbi:Cullin-associated NEDD8-dissociated protein 1 [Chytridiales sp. JEL 0842]|nr:Cullin-associated NEDD8-dissociated protein 1 [Chytridiales sp. JEL 0842]